MEVSGYRGESGLKGFGELQQVFVGATTMNILYYLWGLIPRPEARRGGSRGLILSKLYHP